MIRLRIYIMFVNAIYDKQIDAPLQQVAARLFTKENNMDGFTFYENSDHISIENDDLHFRFNIYNDGSGNFFSTRDGLVVDVPTVDVINLGGFSNPQKFDNIRHDIMHIWYYYVSRGELSPNHRKLMAIDDTPLWRCHWEEYKIESLEMYILTGEKREALPYYERAQAFIEWVMTALRH